MKTTLKKYLYFDALDPQQNEIFHILDKARYLQTKLISKLLSDFFRKHGIDRNTPINRIKLIIQLYLEEGDSAASSIQPKTPSSQDALAAMIRLLVSQSTVTENNPHSPISGHASGQSETVLPENAVRSKGRSAHNPNTVFPDTISETDRLRQMAQGFLSMACE